MKSNSKYITFVKGSSVGKQNLTEELKMYILYDMIGAAVSKLLFQT